MTTHYETIGAHGIRRFRSAISAVRDWRERVATEPDARDGTQPFLDQISPTGIVRIWQADDRPAGLGEALRRALEMD